MDAGQLRHRITIEQATLSAPSPSGQRRTSWYDFATRWAAIKPLSGRELEVAKSIAATVSHKVIIRYTDGILPTHRVRYGARLFEINAALNEEENFVQTSLYCTESPQTPLNDGPTILTEEDGITLICAEDENLLTV